ncbi:hypothetical protein DL764_006942 [Monosporascus ibericus]|uniref:Helicase ATP-binding domain-containing protein n=1 Tax=Monosporascus ibericus TaxID=155417 RepID=A0A4V1X9X9_9PEZI|nr:hypothetical protein DL764_006942 [Monosporascus ibericus]
MPPRRQAAASANGSKATQTATTASASVQRKRKAPAPAPEPQESGVAADSHDSADLQEEQRKRQKPFARKGLTAQQKHTILQNGTTQAESSEAEDAEIDDENGDGPSDRNGLDRSKPPIASVEEAFRDLVENVANQPLNDLAAAGGFKVRVATMCSGTDSPIFALELIKSAYGGINPAQHFLEIRHAFSVEYVPWKAAFIRRNTDTIVFGDVRDFGGQADTLLTALGSMEKIPSDIDVLIAGTPCVDFSSLNSNKVKDFTTKVGDRLKKLFQRFDKQKDKAEDAPIIAGVKKFMEGECMETLKDQGQSSGAFFAMLSYARLRRPKCILLENVHSAPWEQMVRVWFPSIDYAAHFVRLDTKNYYIPQTRSRGYLLAVDACLFNSKKNIAEDIVNKWATDIKNFQRRASTPIDRWLLPSTDPLADLARQDEEASFLDRKRRDNVPWIQSRRRHIRVRRQEMLGEDRALTNWTEDGGSRPYDRMDKILMHGQPPRVLDAIEVYYLRGVKNGLHRKAKQDFDPASRFDILFKTRVIDLSQNVDRNSGGAPFGLIGCVTPDGIPFLTDQGRVLSGFETLQLQGLPIQRINFSTEDQDQLRDLAGNAITTTVVGSALVALFTSAHSVGEKNNARLFPSASRAISKPIAPEETSYLSDFALDGESGFTQKTAKCLGDSSVILKLVKNFRRYCFCNGVAKYSTRQFRQCKHCGTIRCVWCSGNPPHAFTNIDGPEEPKLPGGAPVEVMSLLPSIIKHIIDVPNPPKSQTAVSGILTEVQERLYRATFYYEQLDVTEVITVCYASAESFELRATLFEEGITWHLYLIPSSTLGQKVLTDVLKKGRNDAFFLEQPFARAVVSPGAQVLVPADDSWEFWTFAYEKISLVARKESLPDANEQSADVRLALSLPASKKISDYPQHLQRILSSILVTYKYTPTCDTAEKSLFRYEDSLYLFKDPTKTGIPNHDRYVIARNCRLLGAKEHREVLMKFSPRHQFTWLGNDENHEVSATVDGWWVATKDANFDTTQEEMVLDNVRHPDGDTDDIHDQLWMSCESLIKKDAADHKAHLLSHFQFTLPNHYTPERLLALIGDCTSPGTWSTVSAANQPSLYRVLAPFNVKLAGKLKRIKFELVDNGRCHDCSPKKPAVSWLTQNGQVVAYEPPNEMKTFEKSLAQRRNPFEVQAQITPENVQVRYLFYPDVLAHRASTYLPVVGAAFNIDTNAVAVNLRAKVKVRVVANIKQEYKPFRKSILQLESSELAGSDYLDPKGTNLGSLEQPPGFKGNLSPFQVQSLRDWLDREYKPKAFKEKETEESLQPHLNVRLVGRAKRNIPWRGGVVADDVGYGKTVVSLALMQMQEQFDCGPSVAQRTAKTASCIHLKATLVIAPDHLVNQWKTEAQKFRPMHSDTGDIVTIRNVTGLANKTSAEIQAAKLIIVGDKTFTRDYFVRLSKYAGRGQPPESKNSHTANRRFQEWYEDCLGQLNPHLARFLAAQSQRGKKREEALTRLARGIERQTELFKETKRKLQAQLDDVTQLRLQWSKKTKAATANDQDKINLNSKSMLYDDACLLEYFSFARVVYDEFSYDNYPAALFVSKARAWSKWVLSATPPTRNLATVCKIANLLGVHIARPIEQRMGLPQITTGPPLSAQTSAEQILSYGKLQSDEYVLERHDQCHKFLKHFASSNPVDNRYFGSVDVEEFVVVNGLTIPETILYLYAQHVLQNVNLDADMLSADSRVFLPAIRERQGMTGNGLSSYYLSLAASCWSKGNNGDLSELASQQNEFLQRATSNLRKFFDKAVWLSRRIVNFGTEKNPRSNEVVEDFYAFVEDLCDRRSSRFEGYDGYETVFAAIFPEFRSIEEVKAKIQELISSKAKVQELNSSGKSSEQNQEIVENIAGLHLLKGSDWVDFYLLDDEKIETMGIEEVGMLLEDLDETVPSELEEAKQCLKESIRVRKENPADGDKPKPPSKMAEYLSMTKPRLIALCESRGIKFTSSEKKDILQHRLTEDDEGILKAEEYVDGKFVEMRKQNYPVLGQKIRKRGGLFTLSHDELISTTNGLDSAIHHTIQMMRQKKVIETLMNHEGSLDVSCRTCGATSELHLVCECGHLLCAEHVQGHIRCGDSAAKEPHTPQRSQCPALLRNRTVALSKLTGAKRQLFFDGEESQSHHRAASGPSSSIPAGGKGISSKSAMIINAINLTPEDDGVLLFVQYPEHRDELRAALKASHINFTTNPADVLKDESPKKTPEASDGTANQGAPEENAPKAKAPSAAAKVKASRATSRAKASGGISTSQSLKAKISRRRTRAASKRVVEDDAVEDEITEEDSPDGEVADGEIPVRTKFKVLLLMVESSESAGTNLQCFANHVMFASPLGKDLQESYDGIMKQAKGRCIRYGQKKAVKVYHFVTENTIEVDILELRRKQHILVAPGMALGRFEKRSEFEDNSLTASYFNQDTSTNGQTHDACGDTTMEEASNGEHAALARPKEERVNSHMSPRDVWKAMNERNWLTTVGLER